jgi:hypothetical protein
MVKLYGYYFSSKISFKFLIYLCLDNDPHLLRALFLLTRKEEHLLKALLITYLSGKLKLTMHLCHPHHGYTFAETRRCLERDMKGPRIERSWSIANSS